MESARYPLPPREHRYGGAVWLVWGGIILGSRTDLHVQSVTMTGHIYQDVILEQHVRLFRGAMGAEFLFMDDNARPHRGNIVHKCLQSENITRMDWPAYSPDMNPIEHVGSTAQEGTWPSQEAFSSGKSARNPTRKDALLYVSKRWESASYELSNIGR
ncbi:transposable element Tc3 transposase [Trichonephila clavipes]|nr:transposable element Tc3 transposase [Trichonephila clavipes]